ncbi:hypothetical protein FQA39_LY02621 [Lamprigera yunnana]|nr:hypothetical protein FQA39_LY02621 [Lamprigera yunnana]
MTEGYPGVTIKNMTTSWRDGLGFCAIIHHFRPDLIDFSKLNKDNIYYNNDLAFQTAERHLGIPALLEPEDMVEYPVPDRLSILTYLSQYYQTFVVAQGSPSRIVSKRPANVSSGNISSSPPSSSAKIPRPSGGVGRRDPCAKCGLPVFIAERLNVGKQLYHRTCFRCARCNSQLTLANYYETETENQFCCEICPDEEKNDLQESDIKSVLSRSLSDEEKSTGLQCYEEQNDDSGPFYKITQNLGSVKSMETNVESFLARSSFINSQLVDDASGNDINIPDLPKSTPPISLKSEPPDLERYSENTVTIDRFKDLNNSSINNCAPFDSYDSGYPSTNQSVDTVVNSSDRVSEDIEINQPQTAKQLEVETSTKDNKNSECNRISLVKTRMLLFENKQIEVSKHVDNSPKKSIVEVPSCSQKNVENDFPIPNLESASNSEENVKNYFPICKLESPLSSQLKVQNSYPIYKLESPSCSQENVENDVPICKLESPLSSQLKVQNSYPISKLESPLCSQENVGNDILISKLDRASYSKDDVESDSSISKLESVLCSEENVKNDFTISKLESPLCFQEDIKNDLHISKFESTLCSQENVEIAFPISKLENVIKNNKNCTEGTEDLEIEHKEVKEEYLHTENEEVRKANVKYPEDLNPFGEMEEDESKGTVQTPKPAIRKKLAIKNFLVEQKSYNPFDEDDESHIENAAYVKKIETAPRISINPFWSDGEEPEDEMEDAVYKPVPLPRNSRSLVSTPEPKPRKTSLLIAKDKFGSNSSLNSATSVSTTSSHKKKPAPKPPVPERWDSPHNSIASSLWTSHQHTPKATPKIRKAKKAPPPPSKTSTTPMTPPNATALNLSIISVNSSSSKSLNSSDWEEEKIIKDEVNKNRQSQIMSNSESSIDVDFTTPNKSTYGKWKRRKGPAPCRPIPQRRHIKPLPIAEIKRELDFIEIQQQGLEKQGVKLEQIIRDKCEGPNINSEAALSPEVEDLILQLFELVNEKNDLFRKQAELMYLRRQQKLEEEYADLEYQIRCLMLQPEANKTDSDKAREEELISRLVDVVERRNEIVECLEMDRIREAEEDDSINNQLTLYTLKRTDAGTKISDTKQKKKQKKEKKFKFGNNKKADADKDIDESELSLKPFSPAKEKEKKKKKFNIFS